MEEELIEKTKEFEDNEYLAFLITLEEDSNKCTLYIRSFGRSISDFSLTKDELKALQLTINKVLEIW